MKRGAAVGLLVAACWMAPGCSREQAVTKDTAKSAASDDAMAIYAEGPDWYAPPPHVRTYPSPPDTIRKWIAAYDTTHIRAHAWDIWESITSPASDTTPVWQTWYAGHEIFPVINIAPNVASAALPAKLRRHKFQHKFEIPRQRVHAGIRGRIGVDSAERWFSFNRFTKPTAKFIYENALWDYAKLRDTNLAFNRRNTPIGAREVSVTAGAVDPESFALKPVFQFVDGKNPSCIPYWNGYTTATTTDTLNPVAKTWKQYVVFDPTGSLKGTKKAGPGIAGCPPGQQYWPVFQRSSFYSITLTQEMADSLSVFAAQNGDDIGAGTATDSASIMAMAKPGNIGLLVAMHVTGKEIVDWTWQTFWWSPTPNDSLGYDRPPTIKAPWNNYQMQIAYQMVTRPGWKTPGQYGRIAYNPYLETSLCENPDTTGGPHCDPSKWYGVTTNCMSCHRMAAWKNISQGDSLAFTNPPYEPAGYISKDSSIFAGYTKTDFLWSVAIRTAVPHRFPGKLPRK